jgi:site-specific DNA-methyltransferase (adenine-specific)
VSLYYEDDHVRLYHGDCREIAPSLTADAIVTDPPYGDTSLAWDRWPHGWIQAVSPSLPEAASLWCFGSMRMHLSRQHEFVNAEWIYGQEIVWEKHNGSGFAADRFKRVHEIAIHWYRGAWSEVYKDPQREPGGSGNKSIRKRGQTAHTGKIGSAGYVDDGLRLVRSVLRVPSMQGKAIHPTEKPLGILDPLIRYSTSPIGTVLDPFAGSGSTLLAAKLAGRKAIGIEADERYLEAAAKRLSQGVLELGA